MDISILWPLVVSILITVLCLFYLFEIARSYRRRQRMDMTGLAPLTEGFVGGPAGV
jgi:hypothetical protein